MKRTILILAIASILAAFAMGCTANRIAYPNVTPPTGLHVQALNRTQFEVLEKTQGAATTRYIALWPLPVWWTYSDDGTFKIWSFNLTKSSTNIARNRAITIVPRADDLFDPITEHKKIYSPWYARVSTTVKGKAVVIKTDDECKQAGGGCWTSIMPPNVHDLKQ
jgi:hypothetical protein